MMAMIEMMVMSMTEMMVISITEMMAMIGMMVIVIRMIKMMM